MHLRHPASSPATALELVAVAVTVADAIAPPAELQELVDLLGHLGETDRRRFRRALEHFWSAAGLEAALEIKDELVEHQVDLYVDVVAEDLVAELRAAHEHVADEVRLLDPVDQDFLSAVVPPIWNAARLMAAVEISAQLIEQGLDVNLDVSESHTSIRRDLTTLTSSTDQLRCDVDALPTLTGQRDTHDG